MQLFVYLVFIVVVVSEDIDSLPDLPVDHYSFYLRNNRDKVSFCENSPRCRESRISESRINRTCWGYEDDCLEDEHKYKIAGKLVVILIHAISKRHHLQSVPTTIKVGFSQKQSSWLLSAIKLISNT